MIKQKAEIMTNVMGQREQIGTIVDVHEYTNCHNESGKEYLIEAPGEAGKIEQHWYMEREVKVHQQPEL